MLVVGGSAPWFVLSGVWLCRVIVPYHAMTAIGKCLYQYARFTSQHRHYHLISYILNTPHDLLDIEHIDCV